MFELFNKEKSEVVNVNDLDSLIGQIDLIDIREPYEFASGSIESAKNIPMGNLLSEPEKYFSKEKTYYIMCQSGGRSGRTSKSLAKLGYKVIDVSGGVGSYVGTKKSRFKQAS